MCATKSIKNRKQGIFIQVKMSQRKSMICNTRMHMHFKSRFYYTSRSRRPFWRTYTTVTIRNCFLHVVYQWLTQEWTHMFIPPLDLNRRCERFVFIQKFGTERKVYSSGRVNYTSLHSQTKGYIIAFRILWATFYINILFYHDVGEISDLSQSEAPNLVMWRVRVMQPTAPPPWTRSHSWFQFNVQEMYAWNVIRKYTAEQY